MSVANMKAAEKKPAFRPMCSCSLLPGSHFADKCKVVADRQARAQRHFEWQQRKLEREERQAANEQKRKARQEEREQDPKHAAYLERQAKRDAAQAKRDAEAKAEAREARGREAHLRFLAQLRAQKIADEQKVHQEVADEPKLQQGADVNDWSAPKLGDSFLKNLPEESSKKEKQVADDASTVASETTYVPESRQHRGPFLYFTKAEAQRLEKVKSALNELNYLQKQVDAGKKYELDRSQFAKIHGKHAEKRRKELEESDVIRMERAGYQLRDKYW
jgi:hypothetical protein